MSPQEFLQWIEETEATGPEFMIALNEQEIETSSWTEEETRTVTTALAEKAPAATAWFAERSFFPDEVRSTADSEFKTTEEGERILDEIDTDNDGLTSGIELVTAYQSSDAAVRNEADRKSIEEFGMPAWALGQSGVGQPGVTPELALNELLDAVYEDTGVRATDWDSIPDEWKVNRALEAGVENYRPQDDPAEEEPPFQLRREYEMEDGSTELVGVGLAEEAMRVFDLSEDSLANTIRLANRERMFRVAGQNGAGVTKWQPLAALLRATGQTADELFDREALKDEAERLAGHWNDAKQRFGEDSTQAKVAYDMFRSARDKWMNVSTGQDAMNLPSQITGRYNAGYQKYGGNDVLAFFHSLDPGLAARMNETNIDPELMTDDELKMMVGYISTAFPGSADVDQLVGDLIGVGFGEPSIGLAGLIERAASAKAARDGSGAGSGPIRVMPDRVQVEQAAKDFYQQLFMEEPDEATVKSFADKIMNDVASAPIDQNVDVNARIRQQAESMPAYKELYGKRGNLDEAEYQGMMRAGTASMLGEELAGNVPTKLGMKSGKYQTAVGAAAGTSEAWDNSTFLGRLARASQTVSANT